MQLVPLSEFNPCHEPSGSEAGGQFAPKGQGDCEEGPSVERAKVDHLARTIARDADTEEERIHAKAIAQAEIDNRKLLDQYGPEGTRSKYYDKKTGEYTPERQKVHDQIIQKLLTHEQQKDGTWVPRKEPLQPQQHPVAILMGGMSASGKTTAAGTLNYANKLLINSDDVKTLLPEWTGTNASILHDESQDIADRLYEIARSNHYNMVLDSTMRSLGGVDYEGARPGVSPANRIQTLKRDGYRVEARFTDVDIDTSLQRSLKRFADQKAKTGKGRYVPIGYIKANYDARYGTRPRRTFEQVKHLLDAYRIVDNRGKKPRPIGHRGKLTEVDRVYWRADEPPPLREVEAAQRYAENFTRRFLRRGSL